ncbi:DEHA2E11572p [Debaryomyces hansenii CBS767]|uniref:DEHA2E11572p n=1 Tax=Debaryomyces hansenii (strain ATCC 36239 / CBS 767 / BCRC 21394 / JCM 1990 / NBRC 0083 / IGC 2968) TaxID=284592 RepID=Q6BPQ8_DEBHA|nr:DEHA2E11572p [Debaryomyces hansenii CBS767]CAG88051.2 DEHA2E11572p [Debaryomyces hansenii CBS767]|eukprot:XP_459812.2 DEHA2E11572p [Debaryomyces hansenii CBS767]
MYLNNSNNVTSKKRIRVACDTCRRKKIKCDGQYPCGNCQQLNGSGCNYKEKQEKIVKPSSIPNRISNAKTIEILDTRLSKLENVILNLAERLEPRGDRNQNKKQNSRLVKRFEPRGDRNQNKKQNSRLVKENGRQSNDEESDDGDSISIDYGDEYEAEQDEEGEEAGYDKERLNEKERNRESEPEEDRDKSNKKWNYTPQRLEQFFGTHSILCLFSDKSLGWIESALGPEDSRLINPIRNLPFVFYMKTKSFISKWVDPPLIDAAKKKKLLEAPLPKDYRLVFDLLDNYYDPYGATSFICDIDWVRSLFEIYYGIDGKKRRKFKCSELIIMSMVICLCIFSKIDEDTSGSNMSPASSCSANTPVNIQSMNNDQLTVLQEELFDNCVFYYHRISVINDGIETIQAIILLVIYIESSYIISHVSYMLISVAIRFAQEIGLHREESYANLSAQECETRKMIWWCCYCFDMEICFRSGKPPLINGLDISINLEKDFLFANAVGIESSNLSKNEKLNYLNHKKRSNAQMQYYYLLLTRIRAKSYNSLFVASAQTESFEKLSFTLESLNREISKLGDSMGSLMRPRFYNDPEFHNIYRQFEAPNLKDILILNFIYFSHLMIINRIPFLIGIPDCDETFEKGLSFRNRFLDSARTILVIAKNMPRENIGISLYNWLVFFPSAAFMSLSAACINHPTAPGTYDDVNLLIDSSMNFFSIKKAWPVEGFSRFKVYQSKEALVHLISKILLKIVIRVFETKTGIQILANNELLREHLESTERQFPDIFKENRDFSSQFASVLKGSSFGTQGFIKIGGSSPFTSVKSFNRSPNSSSSQEGNSSFGHQNNRGIGRNGNQSYEFSNNVSPNLSNPLNLNSSTNGNLMNDESLPDYINDDGLSSIINFQMNSLPNFFFDNNLGL